ncbi:MAG: Toxin and drug export protein A [Desulfovibrio sp.]
MKHFQVLVIISALLFAVSGCGSRYDSASLTQDILAAEETAKQYNLNTSWWTGYESVALNSTVDLALNRNIDLARSAIAVNRALYQARLIAADLLPTFSGDASAKASRVLDTGNASPTWQQSWQGGVSVSYELDLWRRMRDAADAGEWEYRATLEDLASARLALINNVVSGWFYLAYTDQAITVIERAVERYERLTELAHTKYELGKIDSLERLQAEQSLLAARNDLASLRTQRAEAAQTMRNLLNMRPNEPLERETADILALPIVPVDLNVPLAALSARPDIYAAEARLQSAFKTLEADRSAWYPGISIGSTLSVSADKARNFFDVPVLSGLVSLSLPFLDWNRLYWNVKISRADFETAKLNLEEAVTTALNDVDTACAAYVQARLTLEQTLAKHEKDLQIAEYYRGRYELGAAEFKDYLDALNTADSSALSALSAKYTLVSRENAIYMAVGGRYEPLRERTE